ncbi:hypothetical protein Csa_015024 [Cucumis sativus]|uniref:Uncharacterized protein n=1 Tax=Cucumis sativus TaxID=3659 RepID=A0A0A0KUN0_CUCSA|nr:hypothetical protein Csa_015024 [Cucumis sativus]
MKNREIEEAKRRKTNLARNRMALFNAQNLRVLTGENKKGERIGSPIVYEMDERIGGKSVTG